MKIIWRSSAVQSLIRLDNWRKDNGWPEIAKHLVEVIESYFQHLDFDVYVPGRVVTIKNLPVNMRLTLISLGKSEPYKVFYRLGRDEIDIFLIRHPRQKSLK